MAIGVTATGHAAPAGVATIRPRHAGTTGRALRSRLLAMLAHAGRRELATVVAARRAFTVIRVRNRPAQCLNWAGVNYRQPVD